jgi:hypothetical protein
MADGRAAIAEEFRNVGRRRALGLLISQVEEADAEGDDLFVDDGPAVTALVPPLLVSRMRRHPVDFDAGQVLFVQVVRPSSTTVSRISSAAMPVSMCQNGSGQRDSSRSVQPLPRMRLSDAEQTGSLLKVRTMCRRCTTSWNSMNIDPSPGPRGRRRRDVADWRYG